MKTITNYLQEERSFEKQNSVKALVKRGNYVLIIRRQEGHPGAGQWDLPGGHIEKGENKEDALKREVCEEVDLEIEDIKFIKKSNLKIPEKGIDSDMNLYCCKAKSCGVELKPADWEGADGKAEHNEYAWIENKTDLEKSLEM